MKSSTTALLIFLFIATLGVAAYLWGSHGLAQMDIEAQLNHKFLVAAYVLAWTIQFGYALWLLIKWQTHKRAAARMDSDRR
jgi:hypothetical protein